MRKLFKSLAWFFLVFVALSLAFIYFVYLSVTPLATNKFLDLEIKPGMTGSEIAGILAKEKLISSQWSFKILLRLSGREKELKSGFYRLSSNSSAFEILKKLVKGEIEYKFVTFPEGITLKEMAEVLAQERLMSAADFIKAAQSSPFKAGQESITDLEGFLLPETYKVPRGISAKGMVEIMQAEFSRQIVPAYQKAKNKLPLPLNLKEAVTLASLVEREAKLPKERPVIARVYYNRLLKQMNLECDATIQYALGKVKPELSYSDLKIDSPYNTYLYPGLPPGPIGNPGKASILAAFSPKKNGYLFYVLNYDKNDGSHLFSETYQEHLNKIRSFKN